MSPTGNRDRRGRGEVSAVRRAWKLTRAEARLHWLAPAACAAGGPPGLGTRVAPASCCAPAAGWARLGSPPVRTSCGLGSVVRACSAKAAAAHPRPVASPTAAVCPGEADRSCRRWGAAANGQCRQPWETQDLSQRLETAAPWFFFLCFIPALAVVPFFWLRQSLVKVIFSRVCFCRPGL